MKETEHCSAHYLCLLWYIVSIVSFLWILSLVNERLVGVCVCNQLSQKDKIDVIVQQSLTLSSHYFPLLQCELEGTLLPISLQTSVFGCYQFLDRILLMDIMLVGLYFHLKNTREPTECFIHLFVTVYKHFMFLCCHPCRNLTYELI